ncbi:relaxase/mobilization nuclease domain-containing protein [Amniculibacterium sp. G2-70]|uniref:relaxase/mobilization nuclease domain-containing protein n=1 Tax=Amniculibacterium sp. G2-70 TaxID=2767188 RepID=UPI0016548915|nr:relaxase/mobilization nuclease domain-containing protein [Amniculibacterium sp. G2-70]MBS1548269.1 relaxase/mobilization nuclease domain-containing protein [Bacteroidota bacterium]
MIVKILGSASSEFHGVQYNDKKVEKGTGELMLMKNFPSFINENSSQQEVRDYFKSVSKNEKVKKPQFHAVISTKFREHSKEELAKIAEDFMQEMKYGSQPFIVVFHNDTENNHVHIVSTRVDKKSGKKINDSYEKLKAQKALSNVLEKRFGIDNEKRIDELLQYKFGSLKQLETLLTRNGYKLSENTNDERALTILKNGVFQRTFFENQMVFENRKNENRAKQLKAILGKYKNLCSNKVFKVEDLRHLEKMFPEEKHKNDWKPKIEFESELQKKLRDIFGIDMVFHHKDGQKPFGYTIIDHKTQSVFKGSEIMKMNELFEFTNEKMDKRLFESLKDFNISDETSKQALIQHLKRKNPENVIKDFMLFENKKLKDKETFNSIKNDVKEYLKTQNKNDVELIKSEDGKYYAIHSKLHYVGELEALIGEKEYQFFLNPSSTKSSENENKTLSKELKKSINDLIFEFSKSSGSGKDPSENEFKKRRKRKK